MNQAVTDNEALDAEARGVAQALQDAQIMVDQDTMRLILTEARTHYGWKERDVSEETLRELYDIAKMGPTSMNQQPMRIIFVQSANVLFLFLRFLSSRRRSSFFFRFFSSSRAFFGSFFTTKSS